MSLPKLARHVRGTRRERCRLVPDISAQIRSLSQHGRWSDVL